MECETIKIVAPASDDNPLGYIVINQTDLAQSDVAFDDRPAKAPRKAADKTAE